MVVKTKSMKNILMGGMQTISICDLFRIYARCDRWDEVAKYLGYRDTNVILFKMLTKPYKSSTAEILDLGMQSRYYSLLSD